MSTKLSIQDALKRVHLNTVTLKNEENARFTDALKAHVQPRKLITNFSEKVHEEHVRGTLAEVHSHFLHHEPLGEMVVLLGGVEEGGKDKGQGTERVAEGTEATDFQSVVMGKGKSKNKYKH